MRYRTLSNGTTSFEVSTLCLGAMNFGTRTDPETSHAILDRFVEAGGTFIDTANNYSVWSGGHGRESEDLLGGWLRDRGNRESLRIATKLGAAQKDPAKPLSTTPPTNYEGLSAEVIRRQAPESARHLGISHIDVLYGHVDDRDVDLAETVGAFGALQRDGLIGIAGISNVATWRVVEAREEARRQGIAPYGVVQQQYSYLQPAPRLGRNNFVTPGLLDYAASTGTPERPALAITAYSPLHQGAIARRDQPLWGGVDHPTSRARRDLLHDIAGEIGATPNQVALAWLLGGEVPVIPVIGASSVAQLNEALGAVELDLDAEIRARLDAESGESR
ncbi:aldo/keto reductase [Microbacterium sp. NPDC056234]|uniref:aldo/keto reductase n=1 Tax=Microbacterium sp. NPDC056234 TaxID=3345757 RepID=UPI0035D721C5